MLTSLVMSMNSGGRRMHGDQRDLDGAACEYIDSLKMHLLDIVHAFYLEAIARLPTDALRRRLLRGVLVAGHCYGPLDPASNIILNAVWYDAVVPLPQHDDDVVGCRIEAVDILSSGPVVRVAHQSFVGLAALLRAAASDTPLSEHEAVEYLCHKRCDLSELLGSSPRTSSNNNAFAIAAEAAKHPEHAAIGTK
ncbi:hypothetical protein ACP70R_044503 [Stipagrostis hirtigluma subsp. patula]